MGGRRPVGSQRASSQPASAGRPAITSGCKRELEQVQRWRRRTCIGCMPSHGCCPVSVSHSTCSSKGSETGCKAARFTPPRPAAKEEVANE